MRVLSPRGDFQAHPAATDDLGAIADADVVFIGLKAYSLPALAPRLGAALRPGAAVIAGAERHPLVVLPVARRPARGHRRSSSVDPGGAHRAPRSAPERGDRLRRSTARRRSSSRA